MFYYINAPGIGSDEGCHWGDESKPIGNWSPYVAGANTDADGSTFVKVGLNPVWQSSSLYSTKPEFGLEIECPNDDCEGIPCKVDGSGVTSDQEAAGAGGSPFCVVTVPSGSKANIVVSFLNGSGGSYTSSAPVVSTTSATPTTSSAPTTTSTTSAAPTTSSTTSTTSTTPSSTPSSAASSTSTSTSTSSPESTTSSSPSSTAGSYSASGSPSASPTALLGIGGIFQENQTSSSFGWNSPSSTSSGPADLSTADSEPAAASETESNENAGSNHGGAAMAGLIVALVAAGYML
ncbi:hypothetical protein SLS62_002549 [Diatrype stigma]|uniref:Uncharacterized protein n=1 Tax=Diatrype stigma TaxID=117547 RepID=A0AAN9YQW7_9PEZI